MRYFKLSDFDCQETGNNEMSEEFLDKTWTILGTSVASHSSLPVVTEIRPIALRQERQKQELMPEELLVTYESTTVTKPTISLKTRSQWDLMV